ncbi:MAG: replicative DNA helicase [bacterium]|nr:replicative DNA helicase [bacterium]
MDSRFAEPGGPTTGGFEEHLRAIPTDHEAERAVLGAILLDHESIYKVEDKLEPISFDLPRHRLLYQAYLDLQAKQQGISLITLRSYLEEQGLLAESGGIGYLSGLADVVPTTANIEAHADIVRQKALARGLIRTCEDIAKRGYEGQEPVQDLLEHAEREVLNIAMGHARSDFSSMRDEMQSTFEYIDRVQAGEVVGVRTGFEDFDQKTGGLNGGDLVVLAARPSIGKTALALNFVRNHVMDFGGCAAFFSLEMTKRELVLRMLLGEAQVDNSRFRNGMLSDRDWPRLTRAASQLEEARLFFDDSMGITVSDISAKARRLDREHKLSLLVIDYIQLVQGRTTIDHREQQVADISRSLKLLAKDLDVPVIALSQLNRGPEGRNDKRPMLADLRESGAIEQDADIVMFIYRDDVYDEESPDAGLAEVIIAKQRNGPIGTVKLQFAKEFGRFHDLTRRDTVPPVDQGFDPEPEPEPGAWGGKMESPF